MFEREQVQVREWLEKQPFYPTQRRWEPLLGASEELGELCRAHLKQHQKIRGTSAEHDAKAQDAIGDCLIYLMGFCIHEKISLSDCDRGIHVNHLLTPEETLMATVEKVGHLVGLYKYHDEHYHGGSYSLGRQQRVRYVLGEVVGWLNAYCMSRGYKLQKCLDLAMAEVMARDWNKNPLNGSVEAK